MASAAVAPFGRPGIRLQPLGGGLAAKPTHLLQLALYRLPPALRQACRARIACLVVPRFPLELELQRQPGLRGQAVVIGGGPGQPNTVLDCSTEAERWGVRPGQPLRQALAHCHHAACVEARPAHYAEANDRLFRALYGVSPSIEVREPGCLYVSVEGLGDSEEALLDRLAAAAHAACGVRPQAAIASGKYPAYTAALTADEPRVIPAGETASFVGQLSCDHLPLPFELRQRLRLLGLQRLADVAQLPKSALLAQFGRDGARAWELSIGLDTDLLHPCIPPVQMLERLDFDDPTTTTTVLLAGLRTLFVRLSRQLQVEGRAARAMRLRAHLAGGREWERRVNFKTPLVDDQRLFRMAKSVVDRTDWAAPVETLEVLLAEVTAAAGTQPDLFSLQRQGAEQRIDEAIQQLRGRYRRLPLYRVVEASPESRLAERRFALASCVPEARQAQLLPLGQPRRIAVETSPAGLPLRVLHARRWHQVQVIREEFRLREEWWGHSIARRCFRVVLANGRLSVVFLEAGEWWRME